MKHLTEIIAFTSGAVVMILELDGSRIIAPYLGTSTIVWTGLIGVILGSLSLGYWWGGKIADKSANFGTLGKILATAALLVLSVSFLKNILTLALLTPRNLITSTIIGTIILFAPATFFLGIVTPYLARLKMKTVETSGETVGSLYAISTLGSIVGTFLGGFVLISYFGSTKIIMILSAALFLLAAAAFNHSPKPKDRKLALLMLILGFLVMFIKPVGSFAEKIVLDADTHYSRVWIKDSEDPSTGRPTRLLTNSIYGTQSGMFLDNPDELLFQYTKLFDLAAKINPNLKTTLMIGAGAYSYPKHFVKTFPDATLDVVEIDPKLTDLAKKYFGLKDNPRVAIFHEDGRIFLNQNKKTYDAIFNDAFLSYLNIPFQLTTEEAIRKMSDSLNNNGVVMTNLIASVSGPSAAFLEAEYATYKQVFPTVHIIKVTDRPDTVSQNIMLVAMKSVDKPSILSILKTNFGIPEKNILSPKIKPGAEILADDFAPIEKYMALMLL